MPHVQRCTRVADVWPRVNGVKAATFGVGTRHRWPPSPSPRWQVPYHLCGPLWPPRSSTPSEALRVMSSSLRNIAQKTWTSAPRAACPTSLSPRFAPGGGGPGPPESAAANDAAVAATVHRATPMAQTLSRKSSNRPSAKTDPLPVCVHCAPPVLSLSALGCAARLRCCHSPPLSAHPPHPRLWPHADIRPPLGEVRALLSRRGDRQRGLPHNAPSLRMCARSHGGLRHADLPLGNAAPGSGHVHCINAHAQAASALHCATDARGGHSSRRQQPTIHADDQGDE